MTDSEREKLIVDLIPLAKWYAGKLSPQRVQAFAIDHDDLVSVGLLAALKAVDRYDPSLDTSFETYVSGRMRGAMLDEINRFRPGRRHKAHGQVSIEASGTAHLGVEEPDDDAVDAGLDLPPLIAQLKAHEQVVLRRYYKQGRSLKNAIPGRTESRASQIRRDALARLKRKLE